MKFPIYTWAEERADAIVHWIGLAVAIPAAAGLIAWAAAERDWITLAAITIYCAGMLAMLVASAAYNMARSGPAKERLRRLDHAMIFLMIAGSYTPFTILALDNKPIGVVLTLIVWVISTAGMAVKLLFPRRFERTTLALYLGLGWVFLIAISSLVSVLSGLSLTFLFGGGVVYSFGALIHQLERLPFHNAIWHALVLLAAGLHYAAITLAFVA